jgi:hypothetical protein
VQPPIAPPPRARTAEPDAVPQRTPTAPQRAAALDDDPLRIPHTLPGHGRPREPVTVRNHARIQEPAVEPFDSPFDPPQAGASPRAAVGSGPLPTSERRDRSRTASEDGFARIIMPRARGDHRSALDGEGRTTERTAAAGEPDNGQWAEGLASRIDAAFEADKWGHETPIVAPSEAELRVLLGRPDPTRQQSVVEIEQLQRRAAELADPPRRSPHPTAEVDPDDIESAIELAPPARRPSHPNAIGGRPKKSE